MVHAADAPSLEQPKRWVDTPYHPGPADVRLQEGDVIDLGNRKLEIVHLPGHTPGSIGVYIRDEGILFTGDSLQALGTSVQYIAFYNDPDTYVESLRKVQALDVAHLYAAHAYAPFPDSHVQWPDVRRFLDISLDFALGLDATILTLLRAWPASADPATPATLAGHVCKRYGQSGQSHMATATVAAHLRRLARRGEVKASGDEPGASYSAL
jgi:glyoxylase-like metal-dependent hydrolase (beta-lactamase superfamily II)